MVALSASESFEKAEKIIVCAINDCSPFIREDLPELLVSALAYADYIQTPKEVGKSGPRGARGGFGAWSNEHDFKFRGGEFSSKSIIAQYLKEQRGVCEDEINFLLKDMNRLSRRIQIVAEKDEVFSRHEGVGLRSFRVVRMLVGIENPATNDNKESIVGAYINFMRSQNHDENSMALELGNLFSIKRIQPNSNPSNANVIIKNRVNEN